MSGPDLDDWRRREEHISKIDDSVKHGHFAYKKRYERARKQLSYYKVPIIVLSSVNSVFSVGAERYFERHVIAAVTCILALTVGVVQALQIFFQVDERRENYLTTCRDMRRLHLKIMGTLNLERPQRACSADKFMAEIQAEYLEIIDKAVVIHTRKRDPMFGRLTMSAAGELDLPALSTSERSYDVPEPFESSSADSS
uniref:SMODS and SLOG-associating 2TM effector domain-containing protein n=1 Tax=viral metagenome TaxID=1070528 RepID=A0A2V0RBH3_9ZZZZ